MVRVHHDPPLLFQGRFRDDTDEADGVIRGLLGPKFTPIDDDRIFDSLHETLRGPLEEYEFTEVAFTDATSHYRALHRELRDLEDDRHRPGFALRNSEVGSAALSVDDFWLRLVCLNGLMVPVGGKRLRTYSPERLRWLTASGREPRHARHDG